MPAKKVTPYDELTRAMFIARQLMESLEVVKGMLPSDHGSPHPSADAIAGAALHVQRALFGLEDIKTIVDGWKGS